MPMRCPHCGSVVEPLRDTSGALFCPACQNTGRVVAAWPPAPARAAAPPPQAFAQRPPAGAGRGPAPLAPPPAGPPGATPGKAVASLVLGLCSLLGPLGIILGPLAIVYGAKAQGEINRSPPGTEGGGLAVAGIVLGSVGVFFGLMGTLALVVFVLVSNLGEGSEGPPSVAFMKDESGPGGTLTVVQAGAEAQWQDFTASGEAGCILPFGPVRAGDVIECPSAGTVELVHGPTNSLVYATTFAD